MQTINQLLQELEQLNLIETVKKQVIQGFVYAIYPTDEQKIFIHQNQGCSRQLYNLFVDELYTYLDSINFVNGYIPDEFIKRLSKYSYYSNNPKYEYMKQVDSLALSNTRLAFCNAINKYNNKDAEKKEYTKRAKRRLKNKGIEHTYKDLKGMPKFKAKFYSEQSYSTNNQNDSVKLVDIDSKKCMGLKIPKMKPLIKLRYHRKLPDEYKIGKATITRITKDKYEVSLTVTYKKEIKVLKTDKDSIEKLKAFFKEHKDKCLGLDYAQVEGCVPSELNLLDKILNKFQKRYRQNEEKLKILNQRLSMKVFRSRNYQKLLTKVQVLQHKIAMTRHTALHQLSHYISKHFLLVSVEDIDLRAMSQCLHLGKNLMDNGFGMFRTMLKYKMKREGLFFVKINKWAKSSQTCNHCGYVNEITRDLSVKEYDCPSCRRHILRDYNAACNIRDIGIDSMTAEMFIEKKAKRSLANMRKKKAKH